MSLFSLLFLWIWSKKSLSIEMDKMARRLRNPYLGFPSNFRQEFVHGLANSKAVTNTSPYSPFPKMSLSSLCLLRLIGPWLVTASTSTSHFFLRKNDYQIGHFAMFIDFDA